MSSQSKHHSGKKRKVWKPNFEFQANYNDHFETPLIAYQDILCILDTLEPQRNNQTIYDPYYCNGRTAILLRQLGFDKVAHAKRDFYKDVKNDKIPNHDTLITNPPFSESHKQKCIDFCITQFLTKERPFFLLMPNYVAAKQYFRQLLEENSFENDVAYLVPASPYEYDHPEGTGHESPPFASLWFCGVGRDAIQRVKDMYKFRPERNGPRLVTSLEELENLSVISTKKRSNPRQRKKRRAANNNHQNLNSSAAFHKTSTKLDVSKLAVAAKKAKKSSRYRDGDGKRIKKRF
jgi:hypothetical protein